MACPLEKPSEVLVLELIPTKERLWLLKVKPLKICILSQFSQNFPTDRKSSCTHDIDLYQMAVILYCIILESKGDRIRRSVSMIDKPRISFRHFCRFFAEPWLECPVEWQKFRETCYWFVRSRQSTWTEAQFYCREYLATLASVATTEQHEFIASFLRKNDPTLSVSTSQKLSSLL